MTRVEKYLSDAGIRPLKVWGTFESSMKRQFGHEFVKFMELVSMRAEGFRDDTDPYSLKNSSLDFSLSIASQFNGNYYKELFVWLENECLDHIETIVDFGCENGIVSCFLARLFPHATVIGFDKNDEALKRASELSGRLGINNIVFEACDTESLQKYASRADLVVLSLVGHELVSAHGTFSFWNKDQEVDDAQSFIENYVPEHQEKIKPIASLLKTSGIFVSIDRISNPYSLAIWHKELSASGLKVEIARCHRLCAELNFKGSKPEQFPLTYAVPGVGGPVDWNDALSIFTFQDLSKLFQDEIEGWLAETIFNSLEPAEPLITIEIDYDNGTQTIILACTKTLAYVYDTTNLGARKLRLASILAFPELASWMLNSYPNRKTTITEAAQRMGKKYGLEL